MANPWDNLTGIVIGAAIDVHREVGPGLLESAYEECLCFELRIRGVSHTRQVPLPVVYKGVRLDCGFRMDIVVENRVIVEIKAIERLLPIHDAQAISYLRLSGYPLALLMNFRCPTLREGLRRFAL
jgi:GxxExxY protein